MDTAKGILLDKMGNLVTVLTPEGEFKSFRMANLQADIGDEINLPTQDNSKGGFPLKKLWVAAAVAAVFILLLIPSIITEKNVTAQSVAYLSLDINPSVEMELDQNLKVMAVRSLNQDADEVIKDLSLKGLAAEKAINLITEQAYKKGFLSKDKDNAIFLALTPKGKSIPVSNIEEKIKNSAQETLTKENLGGVVQTVLTTPAIRQEAIAEGLSPGKYAILLEAVENGLNITSEDLKNTSIAMAVKSSGGDLGELAGKAHQEKEMEKLAQRYREKMNSQKQEQETSTPNESPQKNSGQGKNKANKQNQTNTNSNYNQNQWQSSNEEVLKYEKPRVKKPEYPQEPDRPQMIKEDD